MHTATQSTARFQAAQDAISLVMNFDLDWLEDDTCSGAGSRSRVADFSPGRTVHVVPPIEINFSQIDILWKLDRRSLERMATNPCTPAVVLERLADHPMADVRAAVSDNPYTPMYVLRILAKDEDSEVRYQLAENHKLPIVLLKKLIDDENPFVASRARTTYERLAK